MQPPSLHPAPSMVGITLDQHINQQMAMSHGATGHFTSLLYQLALAAKLVTSQVRAAGLANVLGYTGETNVQGEAVQKLDEMANETFLTVMRRGRRVCAIASEELEGAAIVDGSGRYAVTMDPLDGSSNIDVNVSIGTIFGIYRRKSDPTTRATEADILQPGRDLRAAGYIIYGSSTMLVYSTGPPSACTGSRSTRPSASSSSRTRTSGFRDVVRPTRATRATRCIGRSPRAAGPTTSRPRTRPPTVRTGPATSGRSSPTRTARCSRGESSPTPPTGSPPRASSG